MGEAISNTLKQNGHDLYRICKLFSTGQNSRILQIFPPAGIVNLYGVSTLNFCFTLTWGGW